MKLLRLLKHIIDYIVFFPIYCLKTKNKYNIIEDVEIVDEIIYNKKSLARFGDGEFKWLLDVPQKSFQRDSKELTKRLQEVIKSNDERVLIGIPDSINSLKNHTFEGKYYWASFYSRYLSRISRYLDYNFSYANSNISRPYMGYKDKNNDIMKAKFDNIKRIWNNKKVLIVEGELTRLGVGNDLFSNVKSIERIICPAKDAFNKYSEILEEIKRNGNGKMILVALGPTATILCYDLGISNYQAIDIGHIDIEYIWYLNNSQKKEAIYGKHVNENQKDKKTIFISDNLSKYEKEIISYIK